MPEETLPEETREQIETQLKEANDAIDDNHPNSNAYKEAVTLASELRQKLELLDTNNVGADDGASTDPGADSADASDDDAPPEDGVAEQPKKEKKRLYSKAKAPKQASLQECIENQRKQEAKAREEAEKG